MIKKYVPLVIRVIVAFLLIQTLFYKFTAHPDSVYIFEKTGLGAAGRIGIGVLELIAAILLLIPRTVWIGASMTLGIIAGAIYFHLTKLGIEIHNDNGTLFYIACLIFALSAVILLINRKNIPIIGKKL